LRCRLKVIVLEHDFSRYLVIEVHVSPSLVSDKEALRTEAMLDDDTNFTALYKKAYILMTSNVDEYGLRLF
jgi:hypothetical protein